jgi:putative hemolysin
MPAHNPHGESLLSLGELRAQVNMLRASKVLGVQEEQIIVQASKLSTRKISEIMIPADDVVMLYLESSLTDAIVVAHLDLHTRFPVTEKVGDPQGIVGYVNFKELIFLAKTHPHNPHLSEITRPLISFPQSLTVSEALRQMVGQHVHLALVRDDHKKIVGLLTQEDIFEEMVGEIQDEFDRLPKHIMPSGKQWVVGGGATVGKVRQVMNKPDFAPSASPETTIDALINGKLDDHPKGGNMVVIDGAGVLIRKVRRHKITEAMFDFDLAK